MWKVAENYRVRLGGNNYINCKNLVEFQGEPLFTLKRHDDGYLGIYFDIYDKDGDQDLPGCVQTQKCGEPQAWIYLHH